MNIRIALIGFIVGGIVGMTGVGGGALMTPLMIFVLGVRPTIAVGTDLVYAAVTKFFGAWQHAKQGSVNFIVAAYLAIGSVPTSILGIYIIERFKQLYGTQVDVFIKKLLAAALILFSILIVIKFFIGKKQRHKTLSAVQLPFSNPRKIATIVLGTFVGFLVGLTSVGSGSLIAIALLLAYPLSTSTVVGTDILHSAILLTAAGLSHLQAGNVNLSLAMNLLVGSIPGILIGSRLAVKTPEILLQPIIASILFLSGVKLIS